MALRFRKVSAISFYDNSYSERSTIFGLINLFTRNVSNMKLFLYIYRFAISGQNIQYHFKATRRPDDTEVLQHVVEGEE